MVSGKLLCILVLYLTPPSFTPQAPICLPPEFPEYPTLDGISLWNSLPHLMHALQIENFPLQSPKPSCHPHPYLTAPGFPLLYPWHHSLKGHQWLPMLNLLAFSKPCILTDNWPPPLMLEQLLPFGISPPTLPPPLWPLLGWNSKIKVSAGWLFLRPLSLVCTQPFPLYVVILCVAVS